MKLEGLNGKINLLINVPGKPPPGGGGSPKHKELTTVMVLLWGFYGAVMGML